MRVWDLRGFQNLEGLFISNIKVLADGFIKIPPECVPNSTRWMYSVAMKEQIATTHYEIRVRGHLGKNAATWFPDLTVERAANGETIMVGPIADQAVLHGILMRIRELGLTLTLVRLLGNQDALSAKQIL